MKALLILCLTVNFSGSIMAQQPVSARATKVAILLYPGAELLDFAGPLEVFSQMPNAEVYTVAAKPGPLSTMKNMLNINPDYTLDKAPQPDILVVPGAASDHIRAVIGDTTVVNWIQRTTANRQLTMSVCTGAYLLGRASLLNNKTVTTHWASTEMLQQMTPKATVLEHTRFVEDGKLMTTAGVSAGIDGALRVVERFRGREAAHDIARIMEYDYWNPKSGFIAGTKPTSPSKAKPPVRSRPMAKVAAPVRVRVTPKDKNAITLSSGIDPVCKMDVGAERADTTRYLGKTYGFCSKICKERFRRKPTGYVQ
ncbi:MAG: DJ-1/PfpI family protein [Bacteroidetes bacterium]|nr:DJ-1/PfpI family protein [Fibrella sp.]